MSCLLGNLFGLMFTCEEMVVNSLLGFITNVTNISNLHYFPQFSTFDFSSSYPQVCPNWNDRFCLDWWVFLRLFGDNWINQRHIINVSCVPLSSLLYIFFIFTGHIIHTVMAARSSLTLSCWLPTGLSYDFTTFSTTFNFHSLLTMICWALLRVFFFASHFKPKF